MKDYTLYVAVCYALAFIVMVGLGVDSILRWKKIKKKK